MKSIRDIFGKISLKNPPWSSFVCFSVAVIGKRISKKTLAINFNKLVEKTDYPAEDKKVILKHLYDLTS